MPDDQRDAEITVYQSLAECPAADWDACAGAGNPFLSHAFLSALEASGSAVPETGWQPQHLLLRDGTGTALGALPLYLKGHSQGEYVFDHAWADAYMRAGGRYYPKLLCAVPFTPATGPRILTHDPAVAHALVSAAKQLAHKMQLSSVHGLFVRESEQQHWLDQGFLLRIDQQFHFIDRGYDDFEGFLDSLASRKRKQVKKERREALGDGVTIHWLTGADLTEAVWDRFFDFYLDTGSRKWGRPYLTRDFFSLIGQSLGDKIVLMMCKRGGDYVAGALNFIGADALYGRYWGCVEDHPFLHFETCYYQAIDYALAHGLARVEAGAQGSHKMARGYEPVTTYSVHYLPDPGFQRAVDDYLKAERAAVDQEARAMMEGLPYKKV